MVSSDADAQLCSWNTRIWKKKRSVCIQLPAGEVCSGDTHVMFHVDQLYLLVTHETQLAIYDASKMERMDQWIPHGSFSAPISSATYSCNCQLIYASFKDGNIGVFDAHNLTPECRIAPSAYLSQVILNRSESVYAVAIAAHPQYPNQFAIGLTDGSVKVIEPLESQRKWGISPPVDIEILNEAEMAEHSTSVQTIEERGIIFRACIGSFIWLRQKLATMCAGSADSSDSGEEIKDDEMGSLDSDEEEEEEEEAFDHQIEQRKKAYLDKGKAPAISSSP
nr:protein TPR1-like [Ipomoea batatas]